MNTEINDIMHSVPTGKLPEGVFVSGSEAVISDKTVALEMLDKDYPIFITDEDGNVRLVESMDEIKRHSGNFTVSSNDIYDFLEIKRTIPERESEKERDESLRLAEQQRQEQERQEQEKLMKEVSGFTGVSLSQLYALPPDVKEDVTGVYRDNVGIVESAALIVMLNSVLDGKPVQNSEQRNYLQSAEELIEGNYNSIDGIINNTPPQGNEEQEEKPSVMAFLKEHPAAEKAAPPQELER